MTARLPESGEKPFKTLSAIDLDSGLVLGCHSSSDPESEHAAIEHMLEMLDLRGSIVCMDVSSADVTHCNLIISGKGHYLLCIKDNDAKSYQWCSELFDTGADRVYSTGETYLAARGDSPSVRVTKLDAAGDDTGRVDRQLMEQWPGVTSIVEVQRERPRSTGARNANEKDKPRDLTVYYISSIDMTVADAERYIHPHRHVEKPPHWTIDTYYGEEASRSKSGYIAQNLAALRR